jgi:hypothetical protein
MGDLIMAREEQSLLENIFDSASFIEEVFVSNTTLGQARSYYPGQIGPPPEHLDERLRILRLAKHNYGKGAAAKELKRMVDDDLWRLKHGIKTKVPAAAHTALAPGLLALAGAAGGYALRNKISDAADDAGEHINSLRDKLANIMSAHHEA